VALYVHICEHDTPSSFVYMVTEHASGTGHEIIDDTMSGDEDNVGERHYAQWKCVSHIRNHDTDWSENISNVPIQPMWILEASCFQLFVHRILVYTCVVNSHYLCHEGIRQKSVSRSSSLYASYYTNCIVNFMLCPWRLSSRIFC
jgi:hypothetical protein